MIEIPIWLFTLLCVFAGFTAIGIVLVILIGFITVITSLIDRSIIKKRTIIMNENHINPIDREVE